MTLTAHAELRAQQRAIHDGELELVVDYGTRVHNAGALFIFMGKKDIPESLPPALKERLHGITLVLAPGTEEILTAYRNKAGLREIKRKRKEYSPNIAA